MNSVVREYGSVARIGVVVPPANTTVEPELRAMLPATIATYASRLPGAVEKDTSSGMRERLEGYDNALPDVAGRMSGLELDAVWLAHTASSYLDDGQGERDVELRAALSVSQARTTVTAADVICDVLRDQGLQRLAVVSPYPKWLTDRAEGYWAGRGFQVTGVVDVSVPGGSLYQIDPSDVVRRVNDIDHRNTDAVLLTGTGTPTMRAVANLVDHPIPVLSSNLCLAMWAVRAFAPEDAKTVFRLAGRLSSYLVDLHRTAQDHLSG